MTEIPGDIRERLASLRKEYLRQLPEKIRDIRQAWNHHPESGSELSRLHRMVHSLSGSGATFGCDAISQAARRFETFIKHLPDGDLALSALQQEQGRSCLSALEHSLNQVQQQAASSIQGEMAQDQQTSSARDGKPVYLVDDDPWLAAQLHAQLRQYGYEIRVFTQLAAMQPALNDSPPVAIIMDMVFPEGDLAGAEAIQQINHQHAKPIPVIFISARDDFSARLAAVRSGSTHYFTKPLEMPRLIRTLDELVSSRPSEAYRILVADDDAALASAYQLHLEGAGMQAETVNDPLQVMAALERFRPDLVLLDVFMPECSGMELAAVIRQQENFAGMPIIFLSTESDLERQLTAINLGGDEFLTKPIEPWHLIRSVSARVKRARAMRPSSEGMRGLVRELEYQKFALDQHAIVSVADAQGKITYINHKFVEISQYSAQELLGQNHRIINSGYHTGKFFRDMWKTIAGGQVWHGEIRNRSKDGHFYWVATTIVPFLDKAGKPYQYVSIRTDISHVKQVETEMLQARDEAERASHAKSEFLARMSHELRTPLNAILGFGQLMESDPDEPLSTSQQENVEQILKAGWHLLDLINEVLDLAKIESGNIDMSVEDIGVVEVLEDCLGTISPLAEQRGITLVNNTRDCPQCVVHADRTRYKQALLNLLSNAIKYNRANGSVTLHCSTPQPGRLRINVTDQGIGLTTEQKTRLFQPFNRLGAENSEVQGTGIGLVITRHMVELMGGMVGVDSEAGRGCTFWIELNIGQSLLLPAEKDRVAGSVPVPEVKTRHRVLYIEDNPANLKLVAQILTKHMDFELLTAHTGELGLALARKHRPELIILDINLPGVDGIELRGRLRLFDETRDIPVIALSANALPRDIERAMDAGFLDYVTKPIKIDKLLAAIDKVIQNKDSS